MPRAGTFTMRASETSSLRRDAHLEVGEQVAHLGAVEEGGAAVDGVRHRRRAERLLDRARLRVEPVEDGEVAPGPPLAAQPARAPPPTKRASSSSFASATTRTLSPGPSAVKSFFGRRSAFFAMTALAQARMWPVER